MLSLDPSPATVYGNAPCVIRTHDRLLRRQLLYPAELREHKGHCALTHGLRPAMAVSIWAGTNT